VILQLKEFFSIFGIPETMYADNMPFGSKEMQDFARSWEFKIVTSSPTYAPSNGIAERYVAIAKNIMKKCAMDKSDIYLALWRHRTTSIPVLHCSPAQILQGRQLRSQIPIHSSKLEPTIIPDIQQKLEVAQANQCNYFDKSANRNVFFFLS